MKLGEARLYEVALLSGFYGFLRRSGKEKGSIILTGIYMWIFQGPPPEASARDYPSNLKTVCDLLRRAGRPVLSACLTHWRLVQVPIAFGSLYACRAFWERGMQAKSPLTDVILMLAFRALRCFEEAYPGGLSLGTPVLPLYLFGFWVPIYNIPTEKRVPLL